MMRLSSTHNLVRSVKIAFKPALLCCLIAIPMIVQAQTPSEEHQKSAAISDSVHKLALLQEILPLNLNKTEMDQILTGIEQVRENVKKTEANEFKVMLPYQDPINKAIENALEKDEMPDDKLIMNLNKDRKALAATEAIEANSNVAIVYAIVDKVCDSGQKNLMANSAIMSPTQKDATKEDKIKTFVSEFLLDPLAYPMLVKIDIKLAQGGYPPKGNNTNSGSAGSGTSTGGSGSTSGS